MSDHHLAHAPAARGCVDKFWWPENFKVEGQASYPRPGPVGNRRGK
ncbi:unnamed protein product [Prunus brigantina]